MALWAEWETDYHTIWYDEVKVMTDVVIEVNVPGAQGPAGPAGPGADMTILRGAPAPNDFNIGTTYVENDYVSYLGKEYVSIGTATVGQFITEEWQEVSIWKNETRIVAQEAAVAALESLHA